MAAPDLGYLGARARIHPMCEFGTEFEIFSGDDSIAWLVVPRGHLTGASNAEAATGICAWARNRACAAADIGRDIRWKPGGVKKHKSVRGCGKVAARHLPRLRGSQLIGRFAHVGLQRGDINQRLYLWIGTRHGDDRSAVTVADQHDRTFQLIDDAFRRSDIICEAGEGLLHHSDTEAILCQDVVDTPPCGAIGQRSVHQHDALCRVRGCAQRPRAEANAAITAIGDASFVNDGIFLLRWISSRRHECHLLRRFTLGCSARLQPPGGLGELRDRLPGR